MRQRVLLWGRTGNGNEEGTGMGNGNIGKGARGSKEQKRELLAGANH